MAVHSALGNGFQEVIYQRALAIEMQFQGLSFEREKEMSIFYKDLHGPYQLEACAWRKNKDKGRGSALEAKLKAEQEFDEYRVIQDKNYVSDFDKEIKRITGKAHDYK